MTNRLLILFAGIALTACTGNETAETTQPENKPAERLEFYGNTQGTTFTVVCNDKIDLTIEEIETILHNFDLALSAYIPNSTITRLNDAPAGVFEYRDSFNYFNRCYLLSQQMWQISNRTFDPTVYPLVEGWGFMKNIENVPDSATVDSLRALVGFADGVNFTFKTHTDSIGNIIPDFKVVKHNGRAKLDFNAIAQGIAVDVIAEKLESKGAENYFVEIGGEIRVKGVNTEGQLWSVGIDKPIENSTADERELQEIIQLKDRSVATSGSYRKFYEKDGIKYSHTIDPTTGYPVQHSLLSATVVAENCGIADAMATAFMVMGPDKAIQFLTEHPELNIEVYLIFNNDKGRLETFYTKDFRDLIVE
ncbi:MAG: FAD:protein FMN transferase [Bacteroidetes bacterium]|nr:FAD:protein FMN transferase [Bacteroidota bacterium]